MPWKSSIVKLQDREPWLSVRTIAQDVRWDGDAQQQLSPQSNRKNGVQKNHRTVFSKNMVRVSNKNDDFSSRRVQTKFLSWRKTCAPARGVSPAPSAGPTGEGGVGISRVSAKIFFLFDPLYARICVKKSLGQPTQSLHISYIIQA